MVPIVAVVVGTWIGLGRPDARTALAAGARVVDTVAGHSVDGHRTFVPPLERGPAHVNPNAIPDPPPPWPRLNPDDSVERAWLLTTGPARIPTDGRRLVTLTFDDGPVPETAPTLLRILDDHKIRAAFFLIGEYLTGAGGRAVESRRWAKRIADAGHYVGNHTFDHKPLTGLSHAAALADIDDSAAAIERATGKRPWLFRPPYGALDGWLEGALRERQLELVLWNIDANDIRQGKPEDIVESLEKQLEYEQGGIVLLHDVHFASIAALNRLLRWLDANRWDPSHPERRGWDIVDLAEYVRATADRPQPYHSRDELERARRSGR